MATGSIKNNAPVRFSLTSAGHSSSGGFGIYYPESKLVMFYAECSMGSDGNLGTAIAIIPSPYRPTTAVSSGVFGRIGQSNGGSFTTHMFNIDTSGNIKEGATSNFRNADVCGSYTI